jgi:Alpha-glutamyl/putrescinyl thymine pyrophosphorylase clade 3
MKRGQPVHRPKRHLDPRADHIRAALVEYSSQVQPLSGISDSGSLDCLVRQIIDSIRRVDFVKHLGATNYDEVVSNPSSVRFDPLKAAVFRAKQGDHGDAVWLVFLAVHFGKHAKDGWSLVRVVYGGGGGDELWNWKNVSTRTVEFIEWLNSHQALLRGFRFSNHRKYESLDAKSAAGTGSVVRSFIDWIGAEGSFVKLVRQLHKQVGQDPAKVFDALYLSMKSVKRFGRLAKFDFLTLLGKLGIAPIYPGSAYIKDNATGPYSGIRLLVTGKRDGDLSRTEADEIATKIAGSLGIGLQEMEDSVCNWQKSPGRYQYFRG